MATTYYHYDQVYDRRNVGYAGPQFGYASMPDQYIWPRHAWSSSSRIGPSARPRSTWSPATPPGRRCPGSSTGAGSARPVSTRCRPRARRRRRRGGTRSVKAAYAESVADSLDAVTSFVQQLHDQDLALVVLGDHQPASIVSGQGASHDVPVSIIAADPAVMDRAAAWGWQKGLRPDAGAPVWPMDAFRDRFLTAYGPPPPSLSSSAHH